jgi:superfamily II DNA or RNA helicase
MDNKIISFSTTIYGVGLSDLVRDKYLVPIHLINVIIRSSNDLVKWMYAHPQYMHKSIIFVKDKSDGRFYAELLSRDYAVAEIYGESDRGRIIHEYQHGGIDVLISCAVLTEGTDLPCTNTVVIARNTKSKALLTQMVGRAMRPYMSKAHCNVVQPITIDSYSKSVRDIIMPERHLLSSYRGGSWMTVKLSA